MTRKSTVDDYQSSRRKNAMDEYLDQRKAIQNGELSPRYRPWNNPAMWHDKERLAASMKRLREYEKAKGTPMPEDQPCED